MVVDVTTPESGVHAVKFKVNRSTGVDRLLASARCGERWAQHWLDVSGFAESEGGTDADRIWPKMYQYRDYVIRSMNVDKPYDRFLVEQLTGDELANVSKMEVAGTLTVNFD